jgi:hypothetical protein
MHRDNAVVGRNAIEAIFSFGPGEVAVIATNIDAPRPKRNAVSSNIGRDQRRDTTGVVAPLQMPAPMTRTPRAFCLPRA